MAIKPTDEDIAAATERIEKLWREKPEKKLFFPEGNRHPDRPMYAKGYGRWAGNSNGREPDFNRCCAEVYGLHMWHQCSQKAKHDPDETGKPTTCGIHSIAARKRRAIKEAAKYDRNRKIWDARSKKENGRSAALTVIKQIAGGHNDPRSLCAEFIKSYEELFR